MFFVESDDSLRLSDGVHRPPKSGSRVRLPVAVLFAATVLFVPVALACGVKHLVFHYCALSGLHLAVLLFVVARHRSPEREGRALLSLACAVPALGAIAEPLVAWRFWGASHLWSVPAVLVAALCVDWRLMIGACVAWLAALVLVGTLAGRALLDECAVFVVCAATCVSMGCVRQRNHRRRCVEIETVDSLIDAQRRVVANLSHEIRTPLYGILGLAECAAARGDGAMSPEDVRRVFHCASSLMKILNSVLDIRRTEEGRMPLQNECFAPAHLAAEVADDFLAQARQAGAEVVVVSEPGGDAPCVGDACKLRQVLYNLVSNAIKFSDSGGRVTIGVSQGNGALVFVVRDTGRGIPEHDQAAVFEAFLQLTPTSGARGHRMHGAGIGLTYVRTMLRLMGGTISVASSGVPGEGAAFTVRVPVARAESDVVVASPSGSPTIRASQPRILVVDDNAISLIVTERRLQGIAVVTTADDGPGAVELALAAPFDMVLMDINLRTMDGTDATRAIREARSKAQLPIVAMTADPSDSLVERCLAVGMNAVLHKPFTRNQLLAIIKRWALDPSF